MINRRQFTFGVGLIGYLASSIPMLVASTIDYYLLPKNEVPHCHDDKGTPVKPLVPKRKTTESKYKWIRRLNASELRVFLKTFKAPPAYVKGMTFQFHLISHHGFSGKNIRGLTQNELFRLHSAAHYGF